MSGKGEDLKVGGKEKTLKIYFMKEKIRLGGETSVTEFHKHKNCQKKIFFLIC